MLFTEGFIKKRSVTTCVQIRKLHLSSAWFSQNSSFALQLAFPCGFILFSQSIKLESSAYLLSSKVKFHTLFANRILQKAPWWQLLIKAAVFFPISWHWGEKCANHLKVLSGHYPKWNGNLEMVNPQEQKVWKVTCLLLGLTEKV